MTLDEYFECWSENFIIKAYANLIRETIRSQLCELELELKER